MQLRRVFVVPRWAGSPDTDFYKWMKAEVEKSTGYSVILLNPPAMNAPKIADVLNYLNENLPKDLSSKDVLLAHSVGNQMLLRWLAAQESTGKPHLLCVAAWIEIINEWETIKPWCQKDYDTKKAMSNLSSLEIVLSDNDPFTPDHEGNVALWKKSFGDEVLVRVCPGKKHFNNAQEPEILEELFKILRRV